LPGPSDKPLSAQQRSLADQLRQSLAHASDEDLDQFLSGYAVATIAEHLIGLLSVESRMAFFAVMRDKYPAEAGRAGVT
jgi:hypothetical protein